MKCYLITAFVLLTSLSRADDRGLLDAGEFVEVIPTSAAETKPIQDIPGMERLLDKISIEPSEGSSPASFIVSGRVVSGNTGGPLERIQVCIGLDGGEPRLAALTNVDGEFKFRMWVKEDHRDLEIQVPKDFSGFLYVGVGVSQSLSISTGIPVTPTVISARYRRYGLKRLLELSKVAKQ